MFEYSWCSKRIFEVLHLPVHISNLILPSLVDLEIDAIIGCCKSHCLQGNKEIKTLLSCVFALPVDTYFRCCRRVSVALSLCQSVRLSSVFFLPFHFNFFHTLRWYFAVCVYLLANVCSKPWNWNMNLTLASVSLFLCFSVFLCFTAVLLLLPLFQPNLEI